MVSSPANKSVCRILDTSWMILCLAACVISDGGWKLEAPPTQEEEADNVDDDLRDAANGQADDEAKDAERVQLEEVRHLYRLARGLAVGDIFAPLPRAGGGRIAIAGPREPVDELLRGLAHNPALIADDVMGECASDDLPDGLPVGPAGDEDEAVLAEGLATVPDVPFAFVVVVVFRRGRGRRRRWKKEA